MSRNVLSVLSLLTLFGAGSEAQLYNRYGYGGGATVEGEYLRGVGFAAAGLGSYNLNTARADRINADTAITLNEYVSSVFAKVNRDGRKHMEDLRQRQIKYYEEIKQRIDLFYEMARKKLNE